MKHCIIGKLNETVSDRNGFLGEAEALFKGLLGMPGIHAVRLVRGLMLAENRYDFMIEIDMDRDALPAYDQSEAHRVWKARYGSCLKQKAIFDWEDA